MVQRGWHFAGGTRASSRLLCLAQKRRCRLRITQELDQLNRDIKALEAQEKADPNAAYIKPKPTKGKK